MSVWPVFLLGGLLTFAARFSFVYAFGRLGVPEPARRALRYVPPAVLSAIVFPELLMPDGRLDVGWGNHRLLAGGVAVLAALATRRTLPTILAGMAALLALGAL